MLLTRAEISALISLAASALRQAAHLAGHHRAPRPCSPARAASTAAFKARMLAWKAMPSMTEMMSAYAPRTLGDALHGRHHVADCHAPWI
jgi:hypothetical protein